MHALQLIATAGLLFLFFANAGSPVNIERSDAKSSKPVSTTMTPPTITTPTATQTADISNVTSPATTTTGPSSTTVLPPTPAFFEEMFQSLIISGGLVASFFVVFFVVLPQYAVLERKIREHLRERRVVYHINRIIV